MHTKVLTGTLLLLAMGGGGLLTLPALGDASPAVHLVTSVQALSHGPGGVRYAVTVRPAGGAAHAVTVVLGTRRPAAWTAFHVEGTTGCLSSPDRTTLACELGDVREAQSRRLDLTGRPGDLPEMPVVVQARAANAPSVTSSLGVTRPIDLRRSGAAPVWRYPGEAPGAHGPADASDPRREPLGLRRPGDPPVAGGSVDASGREPRGLHRPADPPVAGGSVDASGREPLGLHRPGGPTASETPDASGSPRPSVSAEPSASAQPSGAPQPSPGPAGESAAPAESAAAVPSASPSASASAQSPAAESPAVVRPPDRHSPPRSAPRRGPGVSPPGRASHTGNGPAVPHAPVIPHVPGSPGAPHAGTPGTTTPGTLTPGTDTPGEPPVDAGVAGAGNPPPVPPPVPPPGAPVPPPGGLMGGPGGAPGTPPAASPSAALPQIAPQSSPGSGISELNTLSPASAMRAGQASWATLVAVAVVGEAGLLWLVTGLTMWRRKRGPRRRVPSRRARWSRPASSRPYR